MEHECTEKFFLKVFFHRKDNPSWSLGVFTLFFLYLLQPACDWLSPEKKVFLARWVTFRICWAERNWIKFSTSLQSTLRRKFSAFPAINGTHKILFQLLVRNNLVANMELLLTFTGIHIYLELNMSIWIACIWRLLEYIRVSYCSNSKSALISIQWNWSSEISKKKYIIYRQKVWQKYSKILLKRKNLKFSEPNFKIEFPEFQICCRFFWRATKEIW